MLPCIATRKEVTFLFGKNMILLEIMRCFFQKNLLIKLTITYKSIKEFLSAIGNALSSTDAVFTA
jgi:hypothetical protein